MSIQVGIESLYKFAEPYFDEQQAAFTWGIADPPKPQKREDDKVYIPRQGERLDLIARKLLGDVRLFWVVMHYNNIADALDLEKFVGKPLRIPSKSTVEKVYVGEFRRKIFS